MLFFDTYGFIEKPLELNIELSEMYISDFIIYLIVEVYNLGAELF